MGGPLGSAPSVHMPARDSNRGTLVYALLLLLLLLQQQWCAYAWNGVCCKQWKTIETVRNDNELIEAALMHEAVSCSCELSVCLSVCLCYSMALG
jgi:hypothetical protein